MKKSLKCTLAICTLISVMVACSKRSNDNGGSDGPLPPNTTTACGSVSAKFQTDVRPVIQNNCVSSGCHGASSNNGPGPLLTFDQVKNAAAAIKSAVVSRRMPLGRTLTSEQIQRIYCWVDNGALNN